MQKTIIINNIEIPIIEDNNKVYYPISFLGKHVLLKDLSPSQLKQNGYEKFIKQFKIDFGIDIGGCQDTFCISEEGLKQILQNCRIGRLNVLQKIVMKKVCEYIKLNINIDTEEKFLDKYSKDIWSKYDFWDVECIESVLEKHPDIRWQRCSKCGKYYPYIENFFEKEGNPNNKEPLRCICKNCKRWSDTRSKIYIGHENKELQYVYNKYGLKIYNLFKSNNYIDIWQWYKKQGNCTFIPLVFKSVDNVLNIIQKLYYEKVIQENNINIKDITIILGFKAFNHGLTLEQVYKRLININVTINNGYIENFNDAKLVLLQYIQKNNISINYDSDLWTLISNVGLRTYLKNIHNNDILDFIIKTFDYKLASYKFKGGYERHWVNKENRNRALKYLIEEDMKIPIEKIPLYITKENLRKQSNTLRNLLTKYYSNNIWLWINEIYPSRFDEEDFNITVIRNVFDSSEESLIHDVLISKFKNVLYNQNNTKNTIKICGMIPDWFIFTNKGLWIIEYFGISPKYGDYNIRIKDYKEKTLSKIERYKDIDWLRTIYVYPEDLKDNFKGLNDKLNSIEL